MRLAGSQLSRSFTGNQQKPFNAWLQRRGANPCKEKSEKENSGVNPASSLVAIAEQHSL